MSGPARPTVSVVLPTYDRMPYLRAAVESVLAQSFADWELIIVDDGSTDATAAYLRSIRDERVRSIALAHTGRPARVRNEGIARARGEYIAFLDSDDAWHPTKLEVQLAAMRAHEGCRWSYTDMNMIDARSAELPRDRFGELRPHAGRIVEALLTHDALVACPTVIAERRLVEGVGGFDESLAFCEDYDLWLRLAVRADARAITERLADVRQHWSNTRGRPEVNACFVRVYESFARTTDDPRLRRLCRRQQARYRLHLANQYLARGRRRDALAQLHGALRARPLDPWLWRTTAKALLPGRLARRVARAYGPEAIRVPSAAGP